MTETPFTPETTQRPAPKRVWLRRAVITIAGIVCYVVTAVPFGMMVYTIKTNAGIDIFRYSGWHAYTACVRHEMLAEARGKSSL